MDAFVWEVIGTVAGVVGAAAAIVLGIIPLLRDHREHKGIPALPGVAEDRAAGARDSHTSIVVGEIPQQPMAFQSRAKLIEGLQNGGPGARLLVVHAVTGMRGVGKTQLAAEYARAVLADRWRLVAWINAEEPARVLGDLAEVAVALGLVATDEEAAGRAVRHWLEADGERCLLVFDNATDPAVLRPFIPAAGAARVIITSNEQSMRYLGAAVSVAVFTRKEALAFLAERTGLGDAAGAELVAAELGCLALALAQAAAVIAEQRIDYGTYLARLRETPVRELLCADEAGQYPRGVAAAVLLSIEVVRAQDDTGAGVSVMELLAVLSPAGVRRAMIHTAGELGVLDWGSEKGGERLAADTVDRALARLAGGSLLTFSIDGSSVTAHRLVMRVTREHLAAREALVGICRAAVRLLDALADFLDRSWPLDRAKVRDLVEQVTALYGASAACPYDSGLGRHLIRLRVRAVWFLNSLGDSATQSVEIAEPLLADQERLLGSHHPDTLKTRSNLANAYQGAGRTADAIALHEQTLADRERVLGSHHRYTLISRSNLANAYQQAGRTADAITLGEQTLADCERVLGSDHSATLITRSNLANAYAQAGRTADAIILHEQTLADCERVLGSDHSATLATRSNLANAYAQAGRTADVVDHGE